MRAPNPTSPPIVALADADPAWVGGKGAGLQRLSRAGLPVPRCWVVPPDTFRRFLEANDLLGFAKARDDEALHARIPLAPLPFAISAPAPRLAVRSSALDEDGRHRSAAGQYETVLDVGPDGLADAIRRCWASYHAPRAVQYRHGAAAPAGMAVLLMEMLDPRASGVLFTANPVTGSWRELVVEAVWGLGEPLVSGRMVPDRYVLSRPRLPSLLAAAAAWLSAGPETPDRARHRRGARIGLLQWGFRSAGDGAPRVHAANGWGRNAGPETPDRARHRRGARIGLLQWGFRSAGDGAPRVRAANGWGRGARLESETIAPQPTELRPSRAGGVEERATEAPFARKLGKEDLVALARIGLQAEARLGGPQDLEWAMDRGGAFWVLQARPITTRTAIPRGQGTLWTRRFVGERWPEGATPLGWSLVAPILAHFIAYPETSARYLGGAPALARVGGHPYVNVTVFRHLAFKLPGAPPPRFLLDFFPPDEEAAWLRRTAAAPDLGVYASILSVTARERRWQRFRWNPLTNPRAWDAFAADLDARLAALEAASPVEALRIAIPLVREYVKIHVTSLLYANLAWEILSPRLGPRVSEVVLRPPAGSVTVRINAALWALGRADAGERPERLAALIAAHGHRASASWELWSRRWAEDAPGVLALAGLAADGPDPARRAVEADRAAEARIAELSPAIRRAVALARDYLRLREEQRWNLDRILWALKRQLRTLGADWLDDADDMRFLEVDEIEAGAAGTLSPDELRARAAQRRAEPVEPHPADFLDGDAVAAGVARPRAAAVERAAEGRVQGLGISPGVARGRARVLHTVADGARLQPGEILVARATDPSWTPLFARAGGLVLELGSVLSHGAVVAREYRLPGVVNVVGATERFTDGTDLTVDGGAGVVWRHG